MAIDKLSAHISYSDKPAHFRTPLTQHLRLLLSLVHDPQFPLLVLEYFFVDFRELLLEILDVLKGK